MVQSVSWGGVFARSLVAIALVAIAYAAAGGSAAAEDVPAALKERMDREKEARRACKVTLCNAFATPSSDGSEITCDVTKTWLAADIQKRFLGDRLSWPWGHAQCKAGIAIDRNQIATVMTHDTGTLKLKKHDIACTLDHKDPTKGVAYTVKLSIEPTVQFEKGKAVKLSMGWADIEAPALAKGAIWSATKLDQAFSVMSSGIRKEINEFIYSKCAEEGIKIEAK
jgi:hypothetical protein